MHDLNIIVTLVAGLIGALVLGYLANRLSISPIVGYLAAGLAIGPFTPGFVADQKVTEQFAEIGVILLLFVVGLRFHVKELLAVWRYALPGAVLQSALSTLATAALMTLFGWPWVSGIILGMAISVASTVVMALVLTSHHDMHGPIGHLAIGWTVVEDLMTVLLLLLLPILFGGQHAQLSPGETAKAVALALAKMLALGAAVFVLAKWAIPRLFEQIEKTRSRELFTLTVLVTALGISVASASLFGVSMALGAFLAGIAVGRSDFASRAAGDALPLKDVFSILFFVSVGMLVNPKALVQTPLVLLAVLLVVMWVKPLATLLVVRLLGKPMALALPIGAAFSQIGEFSFILGTVALSLGLLDPAGWNALVGASMISIALNPVIYGLARRTARQREARGKHPATGPAAQAASIQKDKCILVGYGPVGKIVHQLLAEQMAETTIVDLDLRTVRELRKHGYPAIYGDALRPELLEEAGVATAGTLILSTDLEDAPEIIRQAKIRNPHIRVFVRCSNLNEAARIKKAGATLVAAGEAEVCVALAEAISREGRGKASLSARKRADLRQSLYEFLDEVGVGEKMRARDSVGLLLPPSHVIVPLEARKKDDALREILGKLAHGGRLGNRDELYHRILEREAIANTGIGGGLAIPHVRSSAVKEVFMALAVSKPGVDWGAADGKPVHVILLLGAPEARHQVYLGLLSRVARLMGDGTLVAQLRSLDRAADIAQAIRDRERALKHPENPAIAG